ncbi:SRPBCC family protein [Oligoflexus tunisiensis]|uniref:SRPBCC family protein n=1 Tax=Oligoflexus tunisiensis TaxID=708132 RepID=UPI00114D2F48|nr:SRPBCC family protein [Oligoflexus tunisiensis]
MLKKILLALALIVVGVLIYASTRPNELQVSREIVLKAGPEVIFPYLNSSQKSNEWMPWVSMDPALKMSYNGPAEGVGSQASWESTGDMGIGKSEIVESIPNRLVKTQLTYLKPMEMSQVSIMELEPIAEGTRVSWKVVMPQNLLAKTACLFMDMDKMIGTNFEQGLQKLQTMVDGSNT